MKKLFTILLLCLGVSAFALTPDNKITDAYWMDYQDRSFTADTVSWFGAVWYYQLFDDVFDLDQIQEQLGYIEIPYFSNGTLERKYFIKTIEKACKELDISYFQPFTIMMHFHTSGTDPVVNYIFFGYVNLDGNLTGTLFKKYF